MKRILIASIIASAGICLACTSEDSQFLEIDQDEIKVEPDGGNFNIKVSSNVSTTTTITYNEEDGWIMLMPKVLKGNGTLSFFISKFSEYDAVRTATANIRGDGVDKVITISQKGRQAPVATDLDLDKYNIYADVKGGSFAVTVATSGEWSATSDSDWCTVENGSSVGIGSFNIVVKKSEDYQYRTATVSVTAGSLQRTVLVQHVGTKIGDVVWANANVGEPDTFCETCEGLGLLYQWNTKNGFPSYTAPDAEGTGNHGDPDKVMPGYEGGEVDSMSNEWKEENDPCPDGWRVPTYDELNNLIGGDNPPAAKYTVDFWKTNGMSVAGAYCGLDREILKADCRKGNMNGAIFIPMAGYVHSGKWDPEKLGKQPEWWNVTVWSGTTAGQTWDMKGLWMCSADDADNYGWTDWPNRTAMSVRCVMK